MRVREGMSETVLTVGPSHTLREAATLMSQRNVGAAVVLDPDAPGPGIVTERDVLHSIGAGEDPADERVADHLTSGLVFADPEWSLEEAASAMVRGRFRHLIVVERGEVTGVLSVRDIIRCWTEDGATSDMPSQTTA
jgi:signal-transduction protein with cAMP-binding, CBS, and nucleotidyltransferase domain